jgi:small subunit ribosomal protein S5
VRYLFFLTTNRFDELLIKMSRNSTMKTKGRAQSFNSLYLVTSNRGFVGVGFGEAPTIEVANKHARLSAYRNLRAVETFHGKVINSRVEAKVGKVIVRMEPSGHGGSSGNAFLMKLCEIMGIQGMYVGVRGRKHPMNLIIAFFKCVDQLKTAQWMTSARGTTHEITDAPIKDYLTHVRGSRGMFGWY